MKKYIKPASRAIALQPEQMIATSGGEDTYNINRQGTDDAALTRRKGGWDSSAWTENDEAN